MSGHTIHNYPGHVQARSCEEFAYENPHTNQWVQNTGPNAYPRTLEELKTLGLHEAHKATRDYWETVTTNYGTYTVTTPGTHRAKIIETNTGKVIRDYHGTNAEEHAHEEAKTLQKEANSMRTIYEGYGIIIKTKNCEHFEIVDTIAETVEVFTGPHAYEATLEELYETNKEEGYYETRDYWGPICTSTYDHSCGL